MGTAGGPSQRSGRQMGGTSPKAAPSKTAAWSAARHAVRPCASAEHVHALEERLPAKLPQIFLPLELDGDSLWQFSPEPSGEALPG